MPGLPRKDSLRRMKKLNKIIKNSGGDINDKVTKDQKVKEKDLPNTLYNHNPFDVPNRISTFENRIITKFNDFQNVTESEQVSMFSDTSPDILRIGDVYQLKNDEVRINGIKGNTIYYKSVLNDTMEEKKSHISVFLKKGKKKKED